MGQELIWFLMPVRMRVLTLSVAVAIEMNALLPIVNADNPGD